MKVNVSSLGVKFYFWLNLWYSALDLIKLFIDEIESESLATKKIIEPRLSIHPKLRVTSSIKHKKEKIKKSLTRNMDVELNVFTTNLKEELLEDGSSQCSKTKMVKDQQIQSKILIIKKIKIRILIR